jgi:hypothetical protein
MPLWSVAEWNATFQLEVSENFTNNFFPFNSKEPINPSRGCESQILNLSVLKKGKTTCVLREQILF